jgi:hypothetical protein
MTPTHQKVEYVRGLVKRAGLTPMWTHYYATRKGGRVLKATSCCLLNESGLVASRGVAVVSRKDNGDKATGRYLSIRRAYQALNDPSRTDLEKHPNNEFTITRKEHRELGVDFTKGRKVMKASVWPDTTACVTELEKARIGKKRPEIDAKTAIR